MNTGRNYITTDQFIMFAELYVIIHDENIELLTVELKKLLNELIKKYDGYYIDHVAIMHDERINENDFDLWMDEDITVNECFKMF